MSASQPSNGGNTPYTVDTRSVPDMSSLTTEVPQILSLKRQLAQLQEDNSKLQEQQNGVYSSRKAHSKAQRTLGRGFKRLVSMFDDTAVLVAEFDRRALASDEDDDTLSPSMSTIDRLKADRTYRGYELMVRWIPSLAKTIDTLDPQEISYLYKNVRHGADGARADDCNTLKKEVVSWVSQMLPDLAGSTLDKDEKRGRGIDNDATLFLLRPAEWDWTDDLITKIRDGDPEFHITAEFWPTFLYFKMKCNPEDLEDGLFKSTLLVKAFKCIFTSPGSAKDVTSDDENTEVVQNARKKRKTTHKKDPTRSSVAEILGMNEVTGRAIAYIAVQLHFALEDFRTWSHDVDGFNYVAFYNNIVDYFEKPPGPEGQARVKATLKWWTKKVLGSPGRVAQSSVANPNGSVSRTAAQRLAKERAHS